MSNNGIAKIQHYVPQFLLRNFTHKKQQVHVFDKKTDKLFSSHTKNIACENGFYNFEFENDESQYTLENSLSQLEYKADVIIQNIIENKSLNKLSDDQRRFLAYFVAVQFVRTKGYREHFKDMSRQFRETITTRFCDDQELFTEKEMLEFESESEGYWKRYTAESLLKVETDFLPYFLEKHWTLYEAPKGESFIIGDNPVTRSNFLPSKFGGSNIGFAVKGIEIHLPISSKLAIALHCPELMGEIIEKITRIKEEKNIFNDFNKEQDYKLFESEQHVLELISGNAVSVKREQVIHLNSLQVLHSERYIFSSKKDFQLVKDMLQDNDELRSSGLRGSVN